MLDTIRTSIRAMVASLPDPIPDLLTVDQAATVSACAARLQQLVQPRGRVRVVMGVTRATTINMGVTSMKDYLNRLDLGPDGDCLASTAKDLCFFRDNLII